MDLFKLKSQRHITWKTSLIWFTSFGVYYALGTLFIFLNGSLEMNAIIFYCIEFSFYSVSGYLVNLRDIGRIKLIVFFQIISLVTYFIVSLFNLPGLFLNIFAFIAIICVSFIFCVIYVYSLEIYPLVLSSKGLTLNIIFGRFGSLVFMLLIEILGSKIFIYFCFLQVICLLVVVSLPETIIQSKINNISPDKLLQDESSNSSFDKAVNKT